MFTAAKFPRERTHSEIRVLCYAFSAAHRRTDCAVSDDCRRTGKPPAHARPLRGRRSPLCHRACKKVLLANNIGLLWEAASAQADPTVLTAWLGAVAYGFQIYFDFSGYSDMAIGLGRVFGFHFLENFNYPFTAKSITDFWRRWHISMGTWFRDYVYIPLGGNRGGLAMQLRNIAIVWVLTGFWHGASFNFVLWGIYFGLLLVFEKLFILKWLEQRGSLTQHIYALFFISFNWPIFGFEQITDGLHWIAAMLDSGVLYDSGSLLPAADLRAYAAFMCGSIHKAWKPAVPKNE